MDTQFSQFSSRVRQLPASTSSYAATHSSFLWPYKPTSTNALQLSAAPCTFAAAELLNSPAPVSRQRHSTPSNTSPPLSTSTTACSEPCLVRQLSNVTRASTSLTPNLCGS
ncbi:hypothetical protein IF1G_04818 [Cordyceps javanica]|uniref:Uncharacterized protein n=1 Tax=Cordyceps javanica TaxID=43265 RepID=A0A545V3F4_9HYPO|nr:hypothetical protein IF1G_04818 [Cordyceps javanica]